MRVLLPLTLLLTFACSKSDGDDASDTDVSTETDAGEDTDVAADTDVASDTDVATDTDVVQGDQNPPVPQISVPSDYTVFFDGSALNIYWRDAIDDVTPYESLEYRVSCLAPGALSPTVTMDWRVATSLAVEGSERYWVAACSGPSGMYTAWVTVRDAAHNEADFEQLTGQIALGPR